MVSVLEKTEIGFIVDLESYHCGLSAENPYYEYSGKGKELFLDIEIEKGLRFQVGSIDSFQTDLVARIVQEQTFNYVEQGAMNGIPRDENSLNELTKVMIGGFRNNDVISVVTKDVDGESFPISAARVSFGETSRKLGQVNGDPNASIATLAALNIGNLGELSKLQEDQVVCLTRFFRQDRETMQRLGLWGDEYRNLHFMVVAGLPIGYVKQAELEVKQTPKVAIIDTHISRLMEAVDNMFGGEVIGSGEEVTPNDEILRSILGYHYGGFQGEICVARFETQEFLKRAFDFLDQECRISM